MFPSPDWPVYYRQMYPMPAYPGYPGTYPGSYPGGYPGGAGVPGGPAGWMQPMAQQVLAQVEPVVRYASYEQKVEAAGIRHTIREVAAISYLMGRGLPFAQARQIVESWEIDEKFPGYWE